jgi:hypothetical protein
VVFLHRFLGNQCNHDDLVVFPISYGYRAVPLTTDIQQQQLQQQQQQQQEQQQRYGCTRVCAAQRSIFFGTQGIHNRK